ncbi:hypothetical protein BCR42DRAFT_432229 [Absidia repens]|uniref:Uncharacterized protein n=1 Tax=Absidia repens TaxID=90262 RepID=A0A1X2IYG1_9FUNG|nr:hypothetical protein BCR42DRAFT_432229 [Absidia repens]
MFMDSLYCHRKLLKLDILPSSTSSEMMFLPFSNCLNNVPNSLSPTESFLFDNFPDDNMIRFSPLGEIKFNELKSTIFKTTTVCTHYLTWKLYLSFI